MGKLCEWLNSDYFNIYPDTPMANSIIKAIMAHLYIAWIHPFGDGNGRLARILEFIILLDSSVPTPAAQLLSNHYNATKEEGRPSWNYPKARLPWKKQEIIASSGYLLNEYRKKTDLTLTRDLDEAIRMGLVKKVGSDYVACFEKILSFLPVKRGGKK